MKQYGLRIKRKIDDGRESYIEVYHLPLSYMDWAVYSGSDELFDPATVRYLLYQYVTRVVLDGEESTVQKLLTDHVSVIESVVTNIVKMSIFQDEEKFSSLIASLDQKSKTLIGCYDLFVFQQMGAPFYLSMLELDAYTRAQVIMMIEKSTGINVKERFDEAVRLKIPLNVMSGPDQYKRDMRKFGVSAPVRDKRRPPMEDFNNTQKNMAGLTQEKMPSNVDVMLSEASRSLSEALNAGRKKTAAKSQPQKLPFDWHKDQTTFDQFNTE